MNARDKQSIIESFIVLSVLWILTYFMLWAINTYTDPSKWNEGSQNALIIFWTVSLIFSVAIFGIDTDKQEKRNLRNKNK